MKLIVGLGNIGKDYQNTRHNIGFMVLDNLCKKLDFNFTSNNKFKAEIFKTKISGSDVIFLKPSTYMNLSGEAILKVKNFYNIDISNILVIVDDINLPIGSIRLRQKGSAGGHNGLKNIEKMLNTSDYKRLRIGVSNKFLNGMMVEYVLGKFSKDDLNILNNLFPDINNLVLDFIKDENFSNIMSKYNKINE